jgi:DNA-nicking Smr family endonuclease
MTRKKLQTEDRNLFRESIGKVRRLRHDKVQHDTVKPAVEPRQLVADEEQVLVDLLSDEFAMDDVQPGDLLTYHQPGIQKTTMRKLRRGEFRNDAELDLHGYNRDQARQTLATFLDAARNQGYRCVRIVHGKGMRSSNAGPILKGLVNRWLRQRKDVLAFHSARPVDGGAGAVYVLLKGK